MNLTAACILAGAMNITAPAWSKSPLVTDLASSDPHVALRAAMTLCMASEGRADFVNANLKAAGYERAEWGGMHENWNDVHAVSISEDFFCDVQSNVPNDQADDIVRAVLQSASTDWVETQSESDSEYLTGCSIFDNGTDRITVQSGGQDPICLPTDHSGVRLWFGGTQ